MKEKALYVRLPAKKHRLLSELAAAWETSLSAVTEGLIDQLLFQTSLEYEPPDWLLRAVQSGVLPIRRCGDEEDGEPDDPGVDNVVNLAGHR